MCTDIKGLTRLSHSVALRKNPQLLPTACSWLPLQPHLAAGWCSWLQTFSGSFSSLSELVPIHRWFPCPVPACHFSWFGKRLFILQQPNSAVPSLEKPFPTSLTRSSSPISHTYCTTAPSFIAYKVVKIFHVSVWFFFFWLMFYLLSPPRNCKLQESRGWLSPPQGTSLALFL